MDCAHPRVVFLEDNNVHLCLACSRHLPGWAESDGATLPMRTHNEVGGREGGGSDEKRLLPSRIARAGWMMDALLADVADRAQIPGSILDTAKRHLRHGKHASVLRNARKNSRRSYNFERAIYAHALYLACEEEQARRAEVTLFPLFGIGWTDWKRAEKELFIDRVRVTKPSDCGYLLQAMNVPYIVSSIAGECADLVIEQLTASPSPVTVLLCCFHLIHAAAGLRLSEFGSARKCASLGRTSVTSLLKAISLVKSTDAAWRIVQEHALRLNAAVQRGLQRETGLRGRAAFEPYKSTTGLTDGSFHSDITSRKQKKHGEYFFYGCLEER